MPRNHNVQGPVGYTIVGSPTIVDGVVSGFSNSDYVQPNQTVNFPSTNSYEFYARFKTPETTEEMEASTSIRSIFGIESKWVSPVVYLYKKKIVGYGGEINYNLSADTWYRVKQVNTGDSWETYVYEDNRTLLGSSTQSYTPTERDGKYFLIGCVYGGYDAITAIDLNNTYIKVNGQAWFGNCPVEVKHIDYGTPVKYTVTGSPTIENGIVSGITNMQNYIRVDSNLPSVINSFEGVFKFKGSTLTRSIVTSSAASGYYSYGGFTILYVLNTSTSSKSSWRYHPLETSSSTDTKLECPAQSTHANSNDQWIWVKCTMQPTNDGKFLYSYYDSIDGQTWYLLASKEDTYQMTGDAIGKPAFVSNPNYSSGSTTSTLTQLDLNESYIKVNGKLWFFRPCTNYQVHNGKLVFADSGLYLSGPVNYTVYGNVNIVDNVAGPFGTGPFEADNIGRIDALINSLSSPFEIGMKIKTASDVATAQALFSTGACSALFVFQNNIQINLSSDGTSNNITGGVQNTGYQVSANTDYWIRLSFDGSAYKIHVSTDGSNYTQVWTLASQETMYAQYVHFGAGGSAANILTNSVKGTIDLNETYVKSNGQLLFYGKNYASQNIAPVPSGYHFGDSQVGLNKYGSPAIVNGVASGFSNSNYLQTTSGINWNTTNKIEAIFKYNYSAAETYFGNVFIGEYGSTQLQFLAAAAGAGFSFWINGTNVLFTDVDFDIKNNSYIHLLKEGNSVTVQTGTSPTNWLHTQTQTNITFPSSEYVNQIGRIASGQTASLALDLNNTYIKVNNEMWLDGSKAAAGVGWFDMRTQKFTGAPAGATLGKDE